MVYDHDLLLKVVGLKLHYYNWSTGSLPGFPLIPVGNPPSFGPCHLLFVYGMISYSHVGESGPNHNEHEVCLKGR